MVWSKNLKTSNDSEIVCSGTSRVSFAFNKSCQQMLLCISNVALVQSPLQRLRVVCSLTAP